MNCEHRGILMAEAAEKLNITDLTADFGRSSVIGRAKDRFGGSFTVALDKAANYCAARLSGDGGGAQIR